MKKADAENAMAPATSARPTREPAVGKLIAASPTSHMTYQGKNQGVTISSAPSVASVA